MKIVPSKCKVPKPMKLLQLLASEMEEMVH